MLPRAVKGAGSHPWPPLPGTDLRRSPSPGQTHLTLQSGSCRPSLIFLHLVGFSRWTLPLTSRSVAFSPTFPGDRHPGFLQLEAVLPEVSEDGGFGKTPKAAAEPGPAPAMLRPGCLSRARGVELFPLPARGWEQGPCPS